MNQLPLPRTDSKGNSYISYSQISTFLYNQADYYHNYVLGKRFEGNVYTEFGSKVGGALEVNDFANFEPQEQNTLSQVVRLDEFEREVRLQYKGFYLLGFIDTNLLSLERIIDYKTGKHGNESKYANDSYTQIALYALALRQETGITSAIGPVNFIQRDGNPGIGEPLMVAPVTPLMVDVDISEARLKQVYWDTLTIAHRMSAFWEKYKGDRLTIINKM